MAESLVLPYQWTVDGVSGPVGFGDGSAPRYLTHVENWAGRTAPRTNKSPRVGSRGDWAGGSYASARTMPFKGCWFPTGREATSAAMDVITGLCLSATGDPLAEFKVRRTEGTRDRWTWARLDDELVPVVTAGGMITFESQWYCPDPRWWSADPAVWSPIGLVADVPGGILWNGTSGTSGDGVLWNGTAGTSGGGVEWQQSAGVSGGSVVVQNLGDDFAPVVFTMAGTGGTGLTNPYVRLESTADVIQFSGNLGVGHSVTVDTGTARVLVDGSYASGVLVRNEMFELPPRSTNTISFGSSGGADEGLLTGYHYHAYQGG